MNEFLEQCDQIWRNFITLKQILEALFSIWQNFEPSLTKKYAFEPNSIVENGQIFRNNLAICTHWS